MSEEAERSDTYYEVQVDRETLVLLGFGFLALLVAAFLVGRWTAPAAQGGEQVAGIVEGEGPGDDAEVTITDESDDVDGEPLFGGTPVSAEGAPPIGAVPTEPIVDAKPDPASVARTDTRSEAPAQPAKTPVVEPDRKTATTEAIPPAAAEGWVVQVSAVKSSSDAKALQTKLEGKGWPVRVLRENGVSKVQVGPFAKRSEADSAERRLKREERLGTWVKHS